MRKITFLIFCFFTFQTVLFVYGQDKRCPGGVSGAHVWLQTRYTGSETHYRWLDFSGDSIKVYSKETDDNNKLKQFQSSEFRYVNFHPSLYVSSDAYNSFVLEKTNLSQGTVFRVFVPKTNFTSEAFLYRVDGRKQEGFLVTNDKILQSVSSGETPFDYGSSVGRDLKYYPGEALEGNINAFKETSARILTYERYRQPNTSVWGERTRATFTSGDFNVDTNPNLTSKIDEKLYQGDNRFSGYSPEIIVYDRVLTPMERRQVESYLALKYGITLDKSYVNSKGEVLWDLKDNKGFNTRITGVLRDNISNLYQPLSTTTYEESIDDDYYSFAYGSYEGASDYDPNFVSYLPVSKYRLFSLGVARTSSLLSEGTYAIWGDNNKTLKVIGNKNHGGLFTIGRVWRLQTNLPSISPSTNKLSWTVKNLEFTGDNWKKQVTKKRSSKELLGSAVTTIPLKGKEGVLSFVAKEYTGKVVLKFGSSESVATSGVHDYGVMISDGSMTSLVQGKEGDNIDNLSEGDRLTMIKNDSVVRFLKNGDLLSYKIKISSSDQAKSYYGSIQIKKSDDEPLVGVKDFYHRGFIEDGMQLEISYLSGKARGLNPKTLAEKGYKPYLIIDRSGQGDFSNPASLEFIPYSVNDVQRERLLFHNLFLDSDQSGMDAFTFGYKKPKGVLAYLEHTNPSCDMNKVSRKDGSVSVKLQEGTGPFTYQLTGIDSTTYKGNIVKLTGRDFIIPTLSSGNYKLEITDTFGKGSTVSKKIYLRSDCEPAYVYPVPSDSDDNTDEEEGSNGSPTAEGGEGKDPNDVYLNKGLNDSDNIVAYPNPVKRGEPFTIGVNGAVNFTVHIYDMKGRKIDSRKVYNNQLPTYKVQARLRTSATYLIKVVTNSGNVFTKRIIIN